MELCVGLEDVFGRKINVVVMSAEVGYGIALIWLLLHYYIV